jgi:DNA-binding response OmpR family regulator
LPEAVATLEPAPVAPAPAPAATGKRVLIVEDERPLAHALQLKMTKEGFATKVCLMGDEALKEAMGGPYDLVLLDLIMPDIDGFVLLQQLRDRGINTPVVVLSNLGQDEDRARAMSLGVKEYFVKANTPILEIVKQTKTILA